MKFRKKPVTIEAIQWTGDNTSEIGEFLAGVHWATSGDNPVIPTLEGDMVVSLNDWIIKGVKGEFYPCKPDIFEATYEAADKPDGISSQHTDDIDKIVQLINERIRPDSINVEVANCPPTYNIEITNKATGPRWSFWLRMDNGQIRDFDGEGGSWDAARSRTEWIMTTVFALNRKGIRNFYLHVEEL